MTLMLATAMILFSLGALANLLTMNKPSPPRTETANTKLVNGVLQAGLAYWFFYALVNWA